MIIYIARRLLHMIPLLLGISLLSFGLMQLAPGNFVQELILQSPQITPETVAALTAQFGLDKPAYMQYLHWLWSMLHLDFGYSFAWSVPVTWLIGTRLFNTLILSVAALIVSWLIAVPIGIHAATHQYSWSDNALTVISYVGISMPTFFSGLLLLYFAFKTHLLPIGGMTSIDYEILPWWGKALDIGHHLILPTIVLGLGGVAFLMRQMRGNLLEVLRQDYVKTARAKGLRERVVVYKHAVRNAINPLITIFGFELGGLLGGAAILETVIGWPGLGRLILEALLRKDIFLVMGSLMIGSMLLIIGNLTADLLLARLDPRIRYD